MPAHPLLPHAPTQPAKAHYPRASGCTATRPPAQPAIIAHCPATTRAPAAIVSSDAVLSSAEEQWWGEVAQEQW